MLISILIILTGAILAPLIDKILKKWTGITLSIFPLIGFLYFLSVSGTITKGEVIRSSTNWVSLLDINISFYLDGLSLLFTFLITGIGCFVLVYSSGYMKKEALTGRYYSYMLLFMGSMLGLVTSDNLIGLYTFWELTSVSSFLLINLYHRKEKSRAAGLQALLVTTFGGLALMSAFILIGNITGSYELSELLEGGNLFSNHLYVPVVILVLLGAFTKSAQFPFHFWLPSAMAAPTPVSAYLHSAAMVNAGVYLVARMNPILGNTSLWQITLIIFGLTTMITGAYFSLTQKDLKRILAYATVSALGILMLLLGIDTIVAVKAALLYLVVHALYKATLFMIAGAIDKKTGTRDIYKLGNLWKTMPVSMVTSLLALASMASVPPMMGYISKKMIFKANVQFLDNAPYILILGFISFVLLFAVSVLIAYQVFFRKKNDLKNKPSEASFFFLFGPLVLAIMSFAIALFPERFEPFMELAAETIKARDIQVDMEFWHGLTNVFWLSAASMLLGILLFVYRNKILPIFQHINNYLFPFELSNIFLVFIDKLLKFTKQITRSIQHGYHRFYLLIVFIVAGLLLWMNFVLYDSWNFVRDPVPVSLPIVGIVLIAAMASATSIFTRSKITAIISMGVVGFSLAIFFLINGAVDLAITFIIVDTLTLVLIVMVTLKLPHFMTFSSRVTRIRDGVVALSIGGVMFMIALVVSLSEDTGKISDFYLSNSLPQGQGENVVNVILVDFRAMDTLGEILVLLIAAVSIFSLLKLKLHKK